MALDVFISWSGDRSHHIAKGLKPWLRSVIQEVRPWLSSSDIEKGSSWLTDMSEELEKSSVGIFCLTPENLDSRWLNFEAGAIGLKLKGRGRVCTYLFDIPSETSLGQPLGQFQSTKAEKEDTWKLIENINQWCEEPLDAELLNKMFDSMWGDLEKVLATVPQVDMSDVPAPREQIEVLEEIASGVKSLLAKDNPQGLYYTGVTAQVLPNTAPGTGPIRIGYPNIRSGLGALSQPNWECSNCGNYQPAFNQTCMVCQSPRDRFDGDSVIGPNS